MELALYMVSADFVTLVKPSRQPDRHHFGPLARLLFPFMVTLDSVASHANALTTFLRGVERRAAVFAQLQLGDSECGDRALETAVRGFVAEARDIAEGRWPQAFWMLLVNSPVLEQEVLAPFWGGDLAPLARLDGAQRATLLLRMVAQLDDITAAEVLGIEEVGYRTVLQEALPQRPEGGADGQAWLAMRDEARYAVEDLTVERLSAIARVRDTVIAERMAEPPAAEPVPAGPAGRLARVLPSASSSLASGLLSRLRSSLRPSS